MRKLGVTDDSAYRAIANRNLMLGSHAVKWNTMKSLARVSVTVSLSVSSPDFEDEDDLAELDAYRQNSDRITSKLSMSDPKPTIRLELTDQCTPCRIEGQDFGQRLCWCTHTHHTHTTRFPASPLHVTKTHDNTCLIFIESKQIDPQRCHAE